MTLPLRRKVLAEFIHVVTDGRRFSRPLTMDAALSRAEAWWTSTEVMRYFRHLRLWTNSSDGSGGISSAAIESLILCLLRMNKVAGVGSVLTTNARDFTVFNAFQVVAP